MLTRNLNPCLETFNLVCDVYAYNEKLITLIIELHNFDAELSQCISTIIRVATFSTNLVRNYIKRK